MVAQVKIIGIETEYGIFHRGTDDPNPIGASSLLVNAYVEELKRVHEQADGVGWDFEDESPANDARGSLSGSQPTRVVRIVV